MIGEFLGWYFTSLAQFWGSAVRIGLPHVLLLVLIVYWIRRRGCGDSDGNRCCWCWLWTCGSKGATRCRTADCCRGEGGADESDSVAEETGAED